MKPCTSAGSYLHRLKVGDRLSKLLALMQKRHRRVERALRETNHLRGDADTALVQQLDGDLVTLADLAKDLKENRWACNEAVMDTWVANRTIDYWSGTECTAIGITMFQNATRLQLAGWRRIVKRVSMSTAVRQQYLRGGDLDLVEQQLARRRGANAELVLGLAHHQTGRALRVRVRTSQYGERTKRHGPLRYTARR